ncbi:MAG: hypothetical protein ABEL97_02420, partial [Salinibacter sp.]
MSDTFDISAPDPVDTLYQHLAEETLRVRQQWGHYRTLFHEGRERRELLAERTGSFFQVLRGAYLDDMILSLVRITEDPSTMGHDNVVLKRLQHAVAEDGRGELAEELSSRLREIDDLCSPLEERRQKLIAHRDKDALMGDHELSPLPFDRIEKVLARVEDFLNAVSGEYDDSEVAYEALVEVGGADALVSALKHAVDYEDALQEGVISLERFQESRYYD